MLAKPVFPRVAQRSRECQAAPLPSVSPNTSFSYRRPRDWRTGTRAV